METINPAMPKQPKQKKRTSKGKITTTNEEDNISASSNNSCYDIIHEAPGLEPLVVKNVCKPSSI